MTDKEALKLALEALKESQTDNDTMEFWDRKTKAITACEKALAARQEHEPEPVQEPMAKVDANDEDYWDAVFAMIRADEQEPAPVLVPIGEVRNGEAYFYNGMYTNKTDVPDGTKLHTTPPQNHV
jgi:hypothetical protein